MAHSGDLGGGFFPLQASDVPFGVEWRNEYIGGTGDLVKSGVGS